MPRIIICKPCERTELVCDGVFSYETPLGHQLTCEFYVHTCKEPSELTDDTKMRLCQRQDDLNQQYGWAFLQLLDEGNKNITYKAFKPSRIF
jgi:hypothetical protein